MNPHSASMVFPHSSLCTSVPFMFKDVFFALSQNKISGALGSPLMPFSGGPTFMGKLGSAFQGPLVCCGWASCMHSRRSSCSGLEVSLTHGCLRTPGIQVRTPGSSLIWQGFPHSWAHEWYTGTLRGSLFPALAVACSLARGSWEPQSCNDVLMALTLA